MQELKRLTPKYVEIKVSQYEMIANQFNDFFRQSEVEPNEETFQLAKEIILSNENMRMKSLWREVKKPFLVQAGKYFSLIIPFVLGVFSDIFSKDKGIISSGTFWIMIVAGCVLYMAFGVLGETEINDKSTYEEMIKNMTFEQYCAVNTLRNNIDVQKEMKALKRQVKLLESRLGVQKSEKRF